MGRPGPSPGQCPEGPARPEPESPGIPQDRPPESVLVSGEIETERKRRFVTFPFV